MEGPRGARRQDFESLRTLTDIVFRPGMMDEYPQLFNEDNAENLRVCLDGGRCVSHVGMTERWASLLGCPIQVCCIGAVSTHPDYRQQGLASACFDDAVRKAYRDGVDVMIVSGDRSLYRMRGCLRVGRDTAFALTPDRLASVPPRGVRVEVMQPEDLPLVMACYPQEPVRFLRLRDDYRYALQSRTVMNRLSDFLTLFEGGVFRGYIVLQRPLDMNRQPLEEKRTGLAEFAGDRHAVLAALPEIVRRYDLVQLRWQVMRHDHLFRTLCEAAGLPGAPSATPGTVKLINFPQLMARLKPRWEELLGLREAERLSFRQDGEQYRFRYDKTELVTDRDTATRLLFGTLDGAEAAVLEGHGALTEVLKTILPLPLPWYGLNYV